MKAYQPYIAGLLIISLFAVSPLRYIRADDEVSAPAESAPVAAPDTAPVVVADPASAITAPNESTDAPANPPENTLDASTTDASTTFIEVTSTDGTDSTDPADASTTDATNAATTVSIDSNNSATTTNVASSTASSGDNTATGPGDTAIVTGNATAAANVVNVVNVNIFDSNALIALLDNLSSGGASDQSVDLRGLGFGYDGYLGCETCNVSTTSISSSVTSATTSDSASISNAIIVRANTGGNTASTSQGLGAIQTGNAYAAANVVNVANTTLIDSNYLMLVLNNFGGFGGNIVLPTSSFFDDFLGGQNVMRETTPATSVVSNNAASIQNDSSTTASTGGNSASSSDQDGSAHAGSVVATGDSYSATNVVNDVNQVHMGGSSVAIVFHIFGNWNGQAFNVPAGFRMERTSDGIVLFSTRDGGGQESGPLNSQSGSQTSGLSLNSSNIADIANNVNASASTGSNNATGDTTAIGTGNAYAASNIMNVANTTAIGRNWLSAIINIFGDWNGNVSFGEPDLWVGVRAKFTDGDGGPGTRIVYEYTLKNNGDAPAHNVHLSDELGSSLVYFESSLNGDVGTMAPGEVKEVERIGRIAGTLPRGNVSVSNTVSATETESDHDNADNTDVVSIVTSYITPDPGGYDRQYRPHFEMSNTNDASTTPIHASSTVDYTLHILNNGDPVGQAVLVDRISNDAGSLIHEETWDLGSVNNDEDITITYSAFYSASTTPGTYTNTAFIRSANQAFADSPSASSTVTIVGDGTGSLEPITITLVYPSRSRHTGSGSISKNKEMLAAASTTTDVSRDASSTPVLSSVDNNDDQLNPAHNNLLAAVFGKLTVVPWMFYAMLLILAILYLTNRKKRDYSLGK